MRLCRDNRILNHRSASSPTPVCYRDRRTGEIVPEAIVMESALRWFYENPAGFLLFNAVFNHSLCCWLHGQWQDRSQSRSHIFKFATRYGINLSEAEFPVEAYPNFNAFFSRRLKPGSRRFDLNVPDRFISPADGKVLVYPRLDANARLPIKGCWLSLAALLGCKQTADRYRNGAAIVLRLAPADYHRFHFSDDGMAGAARLIPGQYHSVNPIALARVPDLFCRNQRAVTHLASTHFGNLVYVEVGAFWVGTIVQTFCPGAVRKGQEKGYFRLGGSTIIVLFEPNVLCFDADLIDDSARHLEVQVQAGDGIGQRMTDAR